jgi:hypothetical protein
VIPGGRLARRAAGERGRAPPATANRFACVSLISPHCVEEGEEMIHLPWRGQCGRAAAGCACAAAALHCCAPRANRQLGELGLSYTRWSCRCFFADIPAYPGGAYGLN